MDIDQQIKPDTPDDDWDAMHPYWEQVDALVEGRDAVVALGKKFLPQFPNETDKDYKFRKDQAKYTNVYRDILEGLAQKPFAHELMLDETASQNLQAIAEDIDGCGNNLHVFAGVAFFNGINNALDWILIDHTRSEGLRTVEEERRAGVRPYWVHIPADAVIWVDSEVIEGREQLTKVKILEEKGRVRTFERKGSAVKWMVEVEADTATGWEVEDSGALSIGVIPMVPFVTGRRKGKKWQFFPPMRDAADLQIDLYQQETALKHIKTMTCFPMLAGNGVQPEMEGGEPKRVPVGPNAVLYAPPDADGNHGEWSWIGTDAATLKFLAEEVESTTKELREIGRQPLTAQSGNLTVITTAFAAQKGNSAVQAWALQLKDALEQAMAITAMWLGDSEGAEVKVFTDFGVDNMDDDAPEHLLKAQNQKVLSAQTVREEFKRRGILGPEFDEDEEVNVRLFKEIPGGEDEMGSDEPDDSPDGEE